jgi:hypothetical protein
MKLHRTIQLNLVVMAALALAGCTDSSQEETETHTNQAAQMDAKTVKYTCSMHPEVLQDKPGECPKCGMKLVEKR